MNVVFCHGYLGFNQRGRGKIRYFRGLEDYLNSFRSKVPRDVHIFFSEVNPLGSIRERASQLREQIARKFPDESVHLITHSMGGLDARFLVSPNGLAYPNVETVTMVSTPNRGSPVVDVVCRGLDNIGSNVPNRVKLRVLGKLLAASEQGLRDLTTYRMAEFNKECLDNPDIRYYSYAGVSGPNEQDFIAPILYLGYTIILAREGRNDGAVSVQSAKWGTYLGEIPADHADEMGWNLSLISSALSWQAGFLTFVINSLRQIGIHPRILPKLVGLGKTFDHLAFYENILVDLANKRL
ncbi:MAG: hypothetical protein WAP23_00420 [Candidatus Spechtbacterales bacterium]